VRFVFRVPQSGDARAAAGLRNAEYEAHKAEGQKLLAARS
jgi:hypothetical protein